MIPIVSIMKYNPPSLSSARKLLGKFLGCSFPKLHKDIRFGTPTLSGAALWAQKRYIHICAFAPNERNNVR
jgi:hypothetical protein